MNQTSNSNPEVKQMTTCFDNGFEVPIKGTNLEPNNYNINGVFNSHKLSIKKTKL